MAIPANTYKTYESIGNREDLSDIISNISPNDTLFYSGIGSERITAKKHEWQTDALAAAAANAQLEGDDSAAQAIVPTVKLYNNTQIQKKVFQISATEEAIKKAGRISEIDYQTAKLTKELAGDIEYAFLQEVRVDGAAATVPKMRGCLNWIITNLDKAADATLNADGTVTGGTARALTETIIKNVLQNVFTAGGKPTKAFCGGFQKRAFSAIAGSGNYRTMVEDKKLNTSVDVYVGDFHTITIVPHRTMPTSVVVFLEMDRWKKATLRPTAKKELALTGDSRKFDIIVEHTLVSLAENANGRITTLTTS